MKFPVSDTIRQFSEIFNRNGHSLYIVGGAVRDWILGIENSDYDFCTDASPEQVVSMFRHAIPTGIKHGTVTVLFKDNSFEVTTFRTESTYSDKRHPDSVNFVTSLEEDLSRRDFTVNAFAADCRDGKVIDLFNGKEDLKNKLIRAIGDPEKRFSEDALRLMRLCRFAAKLGFKPEEKTLASAKKLAGTIGFVSQERIFEELDKTLTAKVPSIGIKLMRDIGLLKEVLPELDACCAIGQNKVGSDNVFDHIMNALDAAASRGCSQTVRWALLLHDIGKPSTMKDMGGFIRFFGHDVKGAEMAVKVLQRLKTSNRLIDDCKLLIANHMVKYSPSWTDGAVKRFINRIGYENIPSLFNLQWCDQIASEGVSKEKEYGEFIERIQALKNQPMSLKDLKINGKDLAELGIPKGRQMGEILNKLLEMVIDYPTLNNRETLIEQALLIKNA